MADEITGLDQAIASVQSKPAADGAPAGLDDAIAQVQGQRRSETAVGVRNSLQFAAGANADEEAKYRHLARFTGAPLETVRADPAAARTQAVLQATDADQLAADHPTTAATLSDPSAARMLHDDIPATAQTESLVRRLTAVRDYVFGSTTDMNAPSLAGDVYRSTIGGLSQTAKFLNLAGGVVPVGLDRLKEAVTGTPTTELEDPYFGAMVAPADRNLENARLPEGAPIHRRATAAVGQLASMLAQGFASGGTAEVPAIAPGMREFLTNALAHATKTMALPASAQGMQTGENVLDATGDAGAAARAGLAQAIVAVLQGTPSISAAGGLATRAVTGGISGFATGQAGRRIMNEFLPESMQQPFDAGEATTDVIVGGGMGAVLGPRTPPELAAAVRKTYADAAKNEATARAADLMGQLGEVVSSGKFRERDQDAFHAFMADMNGPDLYVDARQFAEALDQSGITGDQLREQLPGVASQMREGLQSDGMVRIPMEDYATHLAGSPADAALQPHLRIHPEGPTFAEAQQSAGTEGQALQDQAKALLAGGGEHNAAFKASSDEVHKQVLEQLNAANRFPPDVNRQYADLIRAYYDTTAQRTGKLPGDLYQAHPLNVRSDLGELMPNGEVMQNTLDQPAYHGSPHDFDKFTTEKMGTGEGAQAYGWGMYFAGNKEVAEQYRHQLAKPRDPFVRVADDVFSDPSLHGIGSAAGEAAYDLRSTMAEIAKAMGGKGQEFAPGEAADIVRQAIAQRRGELEQKKGTTKTQELADLDALEKVLTARPDLISASTVKDRGQLYHVDVPHDDMLLDWDKPLSEQPHVVAALEAAGFKEVPSWALGKPGDFRLTQTGEQYYRLMSGEHGGDQGASMALHALGLHGIKYLDGVSRTAGEGSHNYVVFSDDAVKILDKFYQDARAHYEPGTGTIALTKDADLSSFLHEAGHHFLETHARIALDPNAPESIRKDVASLVGDPAEWLAKSLDERRGVHEDFARAFEQYLMEGKAPAPELRSMFQRFRAWLVQVYRQVGSLRANLSDDVRQVMDRMIASDDAIREQEQIRGMEALFPVKPEGMSDADFAAYRALGEQASEKASADLQDKSLRDMKWLSNAKDRAMRAIQAQAREARDAIREEVTKEVDAVPAFQAKAFMRENKGANPDIVAERFGFSSGDEMVQAIADAGSRPDVIRAMTDQRMLERHGELVDPVSLQRAAEEAIHNQARARFIATELNALAKATGSPGLLAKAARDAARSSIAQKRVRDLRPDQYAAAEGRAARESAQAFKKGDVQAAAVKKRAQLLSNALAKEALDARAEIARGVEYLKKFAKGSIRENLGPEFLGQIDALLERYDLRQGTGAKIDQRATLRNFVQSRLNASEMPIPVQAENLLPPKERAAYEAQVAERDADGNLVYPDADEQIKLLAEALDRSERMPYQNMTVEQFRGLRDTVKALEHLARQQNKLLTAEAERTYTEARDELAKGIADNARASGKGTRTSASLAGRALQAVKDFGAAHIKVATWARIMDGGKDNGPVWRYIVRPANDAASKETTMRADATRELSRILRPVLDKVSALDKVGKGKFFPDLGTSLNWQERFTMALNWGNEGNAQRLLGGGIAAVKDRLTPQQIMKVISTLSTKELHAVQQVWDHIETYRPQIGALEKRMTGVEPEWVAPRAFKVRSADGDVVDMRGGYYPITYDARGSLKAQQHADAVDAKQLMKAAYSAAATQHGFTKNRAEEVNGRPLLLTLDGLYRGVNDVIHDLSWREWVRDANKLMRSKTIDAQIRDHYGPEVKKQFERWRDDIVVGTRRLDHGIERGAAFLRQGVSAAGLTFNIISAAMQPLGLTQSIVRVGAGPMGRGIAKYVASPIDATREANAKSEWMNNRMRTRFRELNELSNAVHGQTKPREIMSRYGYWMMLRAQQMVDVPTWHGAYEKALSAGENESTAVHLADQAVKDAQGGGEEVDQAGIERGGPLVKLFTTFYGFMNTAANVGYMNLKTERSAARKAVAMLLLYTVPAILGDLLKDALTPGDSGKWDEEHVAATLGKSQLSFLLGLVAFGREFSGMVNGQDYSGPAGVRTIVDAYKLEKQAQQGDFDIAFAKAFVNEMGDVFGLPSAQINRLVTGANALNEGDTDNPVALLTGVQQPH